jgi:hypothetical protein
MTAERSVPLLLLFWCSAAQIKRSRASRFLVSVESTGLRMELLAGRTVLEFQPISANGARPGSDVDDTLD